MAAKKTKNKRDAAGSGAPSAGRGGGKAKFHGVVVHTPPDGGAAIEDGRHVVVAIHALTFGELPESGDSELTFGLSLATRDADGKKWIRETHESGDFYYVRAHSSLNVRDWVVFDGPVHRFLSMQLEITEIESPRKKKKDLSELVGVLVDSVGNLPLSVPEPATAVLEIVPAVYRAALAANGDDQVLKYFGSLFTRELAARGAPALTEGIHVFEKRATPARKAKAPGAPYVTLSLRIQGVD